MPRGRPPLNKYSILTDILKEILVSAGDQEFRIRDVVAQHPDAIRSGYVERAGQELRGSIGGALHTAVHRDIEAAKAAGVVSAFENLEAWGRYGFAGGTVTPSPDQHLRQSVERYNQHIEETFLTKLNDLKERLGAGPQSGRALGLFVSKFLQDLGFTPNLSENESWDEGVDLEATRRDQFGVQLSYIAQLNAYARRMAPDSVADGSGGWDRLHVVFVHPVPLRAGAGPLARRGIGGRQPHRREGRIDGRGDYCPSPSRFVPYRQRNPSGWSIYPGRPHNCPKYLCSQSRLARCQPKPADPF